MATVETLESRYAQVKDRLGHAAASVGRRPQDILMVAVTKYADMQQVRELIDMGHQDLGESRGMGVGAVLQPGCKRGHRSILGSESRSGISR